MSPFSPFSPFSPLAGSLMVTDSVSVAQSQSTYFLSVTVASPKGTSGRSVKSPTQ